MVKLSEVLKCKCKLKNFHMVSTLLLLSPLSLLNDEMCSLKPRVSEKKKKMSIRRVPFHRESHVDLNSIHLFFSCSIYVQTWHRKRKVLKEQKSGVILTSTETDFFGCCCPGIFINNQTCQYFMESTFFLANRRYKRLTASQFFDFWWKTAC